MYITTKLKLYLKHYVKIFVFDNWFCYSLCCMYIYRIYICMYVWLYVCIYVYMYVCTYVRMFVSIYVCTYVYVYIYIYTLCI